MHPYLSSLNKPQQRMHQEADLHEVATNREGVLRRWARAISRSWQRRKMIAVLEAMDDRLLRDIGIYRADIARVVDGFGAQELRMVPLAPTATSGGMEHEAYKKAA